jgi:hypothetical protein
MGRRSWAAIMAAAAAGAATPALAARPAPPPSPEALRALEACRGVAEDAARLACYDKAAASFSAAQAKGDVVVVDRAKVREIHRQAFGLPLPSLSLFERGSDTAPSRFSFELAQASPSGEMGRWRFTTNEGALWVQTDDSVLNHTPKPGVTLNVRKGALNSFFCALPGELEVRCRREH